MNIIIIGVVVFNLLIFGGIGLLILKNEKIYLKDEGRWIPGFNLPRLYVEDGDEVDHDGFRKHVGLAIIRFGIMFTVYLVGFMWIMYSEMFSETYIIGIFILVTFGMVLYLIFDLFTRTEKYVVRKVSKRIRYDIYIYRMVIIMSVVNVVPMFFEKYILQLVIASILITTITAVYYIYKIYVLLKENKKDFL